MSDWPDRLFRLAQRFAPHSTEDTTVRGAAEVIRSLEQEIEDLRAVVEARCVD